MTTCPDCLSPDVIVTGPTWNCPRCKGWDVRDLWHQPSEMPTLAEHEPEVEVRSDGYAISVVNDATALHRKRHALKDLQDSWRFSPTIRNLVRKLMDDRALRLAKAPPYRPLTRVELAATAGERPNPHWTPRLLEQARRANELAEVAARWADRFGSESSRDLAEALDRYRGDPG